MAGKYLPVFECSLCGAWTRNGDFLTGPGRMNQLGQREWWNFMCFGCQEDQRVLSALRGWERRKRDSLGRAVK